jgi:hypothetical protein
MLFISSTKLQHNVIIKSDYTLEKIERAIKNDKLATLGTQDTILVLIYISVNKCMLSYKTLSVSTFMMFKQQKTTMSKICSI